MIQFYPKTHILAACVSSGSVPGASDWIVEGREFKSHVELRSFSEFLSDATLHVSYVLLLHAKSCCSLDNVNEKSLERIHLILHHIENFMVTIKKVTNNQKSIPLMSHSFHLRLWLQYGGRDITRAFFWLLRRVSFY